MVIGNFNIMRSIRLEPKADAPLSGPLTGKRLKAVGWRKSEVLNCYGGVNLGKSDGRPCLNVLCKLSGPHALKQSLGFFAGERLYHNKMINKVFMKVKFKREAGIEFQYITK